MTIRHPCITSIIEKLSPLANAGKAPSMKAYMKNHFEFLGIQMKERRSIFKEHMKNHPIDDIDKLTEIIKEMWQLPEREYQYCAIDLLLSNNKLWNEDSIQLFEYCVIHKSWWDTVDSIAYECMGKYFKKYPEKIQPLTTQWNQSDNIWLQRCSLLFQKNYKKDTDTSLLTQYILSLTSSKEFFIEKAIGWVLREYAKTNPEWVSDFVEKNELPKLSKREALKHMNTIA